MKNLGTPQGDEDLSRRGFLGKIGGVVTAGAAVGLGMQLEGCAPKLSKSEELALSATKERFDKLKLTADNFCRKYENFKFNPSNVAEAHALYEAFEKESQAVAIQSGAMHEFLKYLYFNTTNSAFHHELNEFRNYKDKVLEPFNAIIKVLDPQFMEYLFKDLGQNALKERFLGQLEEPQAPKPTTPQGM